MGANTSRESTVRDNRDIEKLSYRDDESYEEVLNEKFASVSLKPQVNESKTKSSEAISLESIDKWETSLLSDKKNLLTINALAHNPIVNVIKNHKQITKDSVDIWNTQASLEGSPITSQNTYLFFWDKLEKSNYLLNNIIETADEKLESRVVQTILANGLSDGGQWDMIVNLVNKYGLVPKSVYNDDYHASNSAALNYVLVNKVREYALELRRLINDEKVSKEEVTHVKDKQIHEIYNIIALLLGPPPKADEEFTWEYKDKSVDKLNNVVGGKPIDYVNVKSIVQKKVIIDSLKDNQPVFFGCDVGKFQDNGVLDTEAFDYELAFNTKLNLTKEQRLKVGSSAMTHAMVITAVHVIDGEIQRYKIQNSWGETAGNKGYFVATDKWFDEYVYQVVTSTKYAPKYLTEIWKKGDYSVLPIYDPMGALA
ncbi:unnamed protein product [Wickerhamomyces anomalus]